MILANLKQPNTFSPYLQHPIWQQVLEWLKTIPDDLSDGEHALQDRDIYVNAHTVKTLPRDKAVFEAHQQFIDVHYIRSGGEIIAWSPVAKLKPKTEYDAARDTILFDTPPQTTYLLMSPGYFAIFYPGEAHMPHIQDGQSTEAKKVVVKIDADLLK